MKNKKLDEEQRVEVIFAILTAIYFISLIGGLSFIVNMIYIPAGIIGFICIKRGYKSLFKDVKEQDYYRDIDFKKVSAVASGILIKKEKVNVNTVITAIYELSEKNVISIEWKEQKNYLKLEEHDKEKIKKLLPYEKSIIKFIFESAEDTNEYCLEEILNSTKNDATKNYILKNIEREIKEYINNKYYMRDINCVPNRTLAKVFSMQIIVVFIFGIVPFVLSLTMMKETIAKIIIVEQLINFPAFIFYIKIKFLKVEYHDEVQKLYGLYTYMSDYSFLNEQEIKFYQLYNSYYVYAMGMGIADKFETELGQDKLNNEVRTALQFYLQNRREI